MLVITFARISSLPQVSSVALLALNRRAARILTQSHALFFLLRQNVNAFFKTPAS